MARLPKTEEREKLVSLKVTHLREKVDHEYKDKLQKKQDELARNHQLGSGYGQEQMREISIDKVKKLAEGLCQIDIHVYGSPSEEADVDNILEDRVKPHVEAQIKALIDETERKRRETPQPPKQYFERKRDEIIAHIRRTLLILMRENFLKKGGDTISKRKRKPEDTSKGTNITIKVKNIKIGKLAGRDIIDNSVEIGNGSTVGGDIVTGEKIIITADKIIITFPGEKKYITIDFSVKDYLTQAKKEVEKILQSSPFISPYLKEEKASLEKRKTTELERHWQIILKEWTKDKEDFKDRKKEEVEERESKPAITLEESLEKNPKVVILGEPGSGKTTALCNLVIDFAEKHKDKNDFIPVFISLGSYNKGNGGIEKLLSDKLKTDKENLPYLLKSYRFYFFFDGVNEIREDERRPAIDELNNVIENDKHKYLITSRKIGYTKGIDVQTMEIQEFDEDKIVEFVEGYLKQYFKSEKPKEDFLEKIKEDRIGDLAKNPFNLFLLLSTYNSFGAIPDNRGMLFQYLMKIIYEGSTDENGNYRESREDKKNKNKFKDIKTGLLSELGYKMREDEGKVVIEKEKALEILEDKISNPEIDVNKVMTELQDNGLLISTDKEVKFYHELYQEYFAGVYLKENFRKNALVGKIEELLEYTKWNEVIGLLLGLLDKETANLIFNRIINLDWRFSAGCFSKVSNIKNTSEEKIFKVINEKLMDTLGIVRSLAADALGEIKSEKAEDRLIELLSDKDGHVRSRAVYALGAIKSEKAIDKVIELLCDKENNVSWNAAFVLYEMKSKEGVDRLIELLSDKESDVRSKAAYVLGAIKSEKAIDKLIELLDDKERGVRSKAAYALGAIKSEKAIDKVIELLCAKEGDVRSSAIYAFGRIKSEKVEDLIEMLCDKEGCVRSNAAYALGRIKSEKAEGKLIELLDDKESDVRSSAAYALGRIKSEKAEDKLIDLLDDKERGVHSSAAYALGEINSDKAIDKLIEMLCDKERNTGSAADALREIKKAEDRLIELLSDKDGHVRSNTAYALRIIESEKAEDKLIELLDDKESEVRSNAANALRIIESEKAEDKLIELLDDKESEVRSNAANALGTIKSEKAEDKLIEALSDKERAVRSNAAYALREIKSEKAIDKLIELLCDKDSVVRSSAAKALGAIKSEKAIGKLIESLSDEDSYVRSDVADALGEINPDKAIGKLIEALSDKGRYVHSSAARALGNIKSEKAIDKIIELLSNKDSDVRSSAAYALCNIKSEKAIDKLIEALSDKEDYIRNKVTDALSKIIGGAEERAEEIILNLKDKMESCQDIKIKGSIYDAIEKIKASTGRRFLKILKA